MKNFFYLPDYLEVITESGKSFSTSVSENISLLNTQIRFASSDGLTVLVSSGDSLKAVRLRWRCLFSPEALFIGDAWERGYGDLGFLPLRPRRAMPWYFAAKEKKRLTFVGVRTQAKAFCYWQVDEEGISLYMDMRSGGSGVLLDGRELSACTILSLREEGEYFTLAPDFCRMMCRTPLLPPYPVYGANNWYYAYGVSSEKEILSDTDYILRLTKGASNPPFMVIDDCWQSNRHPGFNGGPYFAGNEKFPNLPGLAQKMKNKGARPGIWMRLLQNEDPAIPDLWRLPHTGMLDPSRPEVLDYIKADVKRICSWGYQLIKHDFTTFDLFGKWGFQMDPLITDDGWGFADRSRTSAEIVLDLYKAIKDAAEPYGVLILGCNTVGHLGAGLMHLMRTGDDTSGREWERTRHMGINTLAFRAPQHRTFYDADADCVGILGSIPWNMNRQWADIVAKSGSSLFISAKPGVLLPEEEAELHEMMLTASEQKEHYLPADYIHSDTPSVWYDGDRIAHYHWYPEEGVPL